MVPALLMFTVIPFGGETYLTNLNVGILFIVAVTAMETIGVFMAGWASNNKYALFGAMRAVAQLVSYEIPLVISVMGVVLIAGSMALKRHRWSPEQLAAHSVPTAGIHHLLHGGLRRAQPLAVRT